MADFRLGCLCECCDHGEGSDCACECHRTGKCADFSVRMETERQRLRRVLDVPWSMIHRTIAMACPMCGADVVDREKHIAWHLRNLQ